jgi:hypothetical protein
MKQVCIRLSPREEETPGAVLEGYFGTYSLAESRAILWDVIARSLCSGDEELGSYGRKEILCFYEEVERLVEAAYCLSAKGPAPNYMSPKD